MPTARTALIFVRHFAATYALVAPRVVYRLTLSCLIDPRGAQTFLHDNLDAMSLGSDDRSLGSVDVEELFPGAEDVTLRGAFHTSSLGGTWKLLELGCLGHVMRSLAPKTVFEIGTFTGRTTRLLAINAGQEAKILTLDLPQDRVDHRIGRDYTGTSEANRISQLHGDSRSFDFSPWHGSCDFVWVDGNHDYPFVVADTASALRLTKPGGWVGWHDYWHLNWWYGVTRCLRESRKEFDLMRHVRGTTIVLARKRA